jgi:glycosyltransferase involved in cell wall biosynthesis
MTVSIVVRAFNEDKHIYRLLFGITKQTIKDPEIILVDSGSTDDTLAIAAQFPVKIVHISPEEFTFGRSLNMGISEASGEIIVIISAHCYPVYPDWLEQLVKPLNDEDIGLSYGRQRGGETNYFSEHQFFRKYFPENSVFQQAHPYSHNANAAIRRELWAQHPYDENLTGLEDLAWSSWLMEEGYNLAYVAEAEVVHIHDETYRQVKRRYEREAISLKQILPESQFSFSDFVKMYLSNAVSDLIQARRDMVFLKNVGQIFIFRLMQYWGTYRGYHYAGSIDNQLHRAFYYPPGILDNKRSKPREIKPIDYNHNKIS